MTYIKMRFKIKKIRENQICQMRIYAEKAHQAFKKVNRYHIHVIHKLVH